MVYRYVRLSDHSAGGAFDTGVLVVDVTPDRRGANVDGQHIGLGLSTLHRQASVQRHFDVSTHLIHS